VELSSSTGTGFGAGGGIAGVVWVCASGVCGWTSLGSGATAGFGAGLCRGVSSVAGFAGAGAGLGTTRGAVAVEADGTP
jgi:hypothetical protein